MIKLFRASLLATFLLLLAACAPSSDNAQNTTPAATDFVPAVTIVGEAKPLPTETAIPPSPTPLPTATPKPPKPVAVSLLGEVNTLHPLLVQSEAEQAVLGAIYVGCVGLSDTGEPTAFGCMQVPTLANGGAKFVGDGLDRYLELTFSIRQGWRWTDGQAVTAQDAVFAWQLSMQPEMNLRDPLIQKIYAMSAPDPRTVVVKLMSAAQAQAAANAQLSGDVAFNYFAQLGDYAQYAQQETPLLDENYWAVVRWLPQHLLQNIAPKDQATSAFAQKPVGDGAFELSKRDAKNISLVRSPQPFVFMDGSVVGIDFVLGAEPTGDESPIKISSGEAVSGTTFAYNSGRDEILLLNIDRFPFDDAKVRQALAHGINREAMGNDTELANIPTIAVVPTLGYSPQQALELLAEAGWNCSSKPCQKFDATQGMTRTLEFTLVSNQRFPRNGLTQFLQNQLAQLGFAVNVQLVFGEGKASKLFAPYNEGGILLTRNFDAAVFQQPDTDSIRGRFTCASIPSKNNTAPTQGNASGFCNPELDAKLSAFETSDMSLNVAQRQALYAELLAAVEQAAPVVRLYRTMDKIDVQGLYDVKPGVFVPVTWNAWEWKVSE